MHDPVEKHIREAVYKLQERIIFDNYPRLNNNSVSNQDTITINLSRKELCDIIDSSFRLGLDGLSIKNEKQLTLL